MRKTWVVLVALGVLAQPGVGNCEVRLNEIMGDPATDWDGDGSYSFRDDEWVEVVNLGPDVAELDGMFLGDDAGGFVFGLAGMLEVGETRVVYGSESVQWESDNGESATGLRLSNDGDTVTLWQVTGPDTLLVDSYAYNTQEADDDRSTGRLPDGTGEWEIFDQLNPFSGSGPPAGNGKSPTPGYSNELEGEPPTPTVSTSWGRVKDLFQEPGVIGN